MKFFATIAPILPLSFILLLFSIEVSIIEEDEDFYDDDDFPYERDMSVKVAIIEDKAYWVSNNIFYEADYIDDEIIKDDAHPVDAFDMDFRDVAKMMIILDNIQEWEE